MDPKGPANRRGLFVGHISESKLVAFRPECLAGLSILRRAAARCKQAPRIGTRRLAAAQTRRAHRGCGYHVPKVVLLDLIFSVEVHQPWVGLLTLVAFDGWDGRLCPLGLMTSLTPQNATQNSSTGKHIPLTLLCLPAVNDLLSKITKLSKERPEITHRQSHPRKNPTCSSIDILPFFNPVLRMAL
ncbi:hypothetical protein GGQ68_000252 [Sagittula marina]|uniref:Uncharacterized protein n=1 Tax=Sagittula marina TaxID=943940 RepID=A0A7W6GQ28_9RHOB|nr:hypothetical protein [Sagittula marina]